MALMKFSISKEASFQGRTNRWSNVYTCDVAGTDDATLNAVIDALISAEQLVHTTVVQFVEARAFTTWHLQGITDIGSTYIVRPISGVTGNMAVDPDWYRELAYLVKFELPRKVGITGSLGRQRSLKKWIHSHGDLGHTDPQKTGATALTAVVPITNYINAIRNPGGSTLVSQDGTAPVAGAGKLHQWLEHRQFPRGRKET